MDKFLVPAKLNLFLYVSGRDENGRHFLQSLFCKIPNLYDTITIEEHDSEIEVITAGADIQKNIVEIAARELMNESGKKYGAKITLDKKIPIAAGLGGGSSNAATILIALNKTWNLNFSLDKLISIGKKIGDDVKFFLLGQDTAYADGDSMIPITFNKKEIHILLLKSDFGISTAEAFSLYRKNHPTDELKRVINNENDILEHIYNGDNHLYESALAINPKIRDVINIIKKQKGCIRSRMSGSGSTCFGIFENEIVTEIALTNIQKTYPKWWCHYSTLKV